MAARAVNLGLKFKSQKLQKAFDAIRNSSDLNSLGDEVAVTKLCLQAVVSKLKDIDPEEMSAEQVAAVSAMAEQVAKLVTSMAVIERKLDTLFTAADMMSFAQNILVAIKGHVEEQQYERVASAIMKLSLPKHRADKDSSA